ncbi:efflux pump membrane fusion protein [Psychroflexus torquis ATCC 700755]|uniref:Efflux pump membrane fusion protein n=1 Tax=Psychroflexus torquis (strain ATCC 700755 / CIP 106069 / ACAM 623) TaxID=313595 RepID=K4IGA8_PSYTT|nr:efflux RND transporter periplasmic adaptor subunit [Psychroflexus torquis]AFU69404.1 efflux pump membrane fusion protein [Psychroflexus torquis ATCC 700755]
MKKAYITLAIPILIILFSIVYFIIRANRTEPKIYVGMLETTEINISSEIPGRVNAILIEKGNRVKKGQVLATLEPDIFDAKKGQAKGMVKAARSLVDKAEFGTRIEEISALQNQYQVAKSQFDFAEITYKRYQALYADDIISKQEMDELQFKYDAANEQMNAAKSIWEMAKSGVRKEDVKAAHGGYERAKEVFNEVEAYYDELQIIAPTSGIISNQIAEEGEVMAAGYPILTLQKPEKIYAIFNVRENHLADFQMDNLYKAKVPGLGNEEVSFKVSYISPMADFATWVPVKAKGEYELKTFEIHLKPQERIDELRPGMSIQIYK